MPLLAAAMDFTMVTATEGNGELIADLAANRAALRKSEMGGSAGGRPQIRQGRWVTNLTLSRSRTCHFIWFMGWRRGGCVTPLWMGLPPSTSSPLSLEGLLEELGIFGDQCVLLGKYFVCSRVAASSLEPSCGPRQSADPAIAPMRPF